MNFLPGDRILFKAGNTWYEEMIVSWSGSANNPITITRYGSGNNPVISSGELVTPNMWVQESSKIYSLDLQAIDSQWINPWAVIDSKGKLMSRYWPTASGAYADSWYKAPSSYSNPVISDLNTKMAYGFSWSPLNYKKIFISLENPPSGNFIVGKRRNAIYMNGRNYITIDKIDFEGPGGDLTQGSTLVYINALIMAQRSEYINITNSNFRNSAEAAIQLRDGSSYGLVENNNIQDVLSAISGYGATHYVTVRNNYMKNIGSQIASRGDRSGISTWGHHWLIENNYIENHGWKNQADSELFNSCQSGGNCNIMDRAFTFCCGFRYGGESGYHIIRNNYFKNFLKRGPYISSFISIRSSFLSILLQNSIGASSIMAKGCFSDPSPITKTAAVAKLSAMSVRENFNFLPNMSDFPR